MTTYVDAVIVEQVITRMEEAIARMIVNLDATIDRAFKSVLADFKTTEPKLKSSEELQDPEIEETEDEIEDVEFEEAQAEAEIKVGVQAMVGTDQVQLNELTKSEEDGKLLVKMGNGNSDLAEQQLMVDQVPRHKVISKTSHIIDVREKFDAIYSMNFVDEIFVVNDPYGFRLLVMGKRNHFILEQVLVGKKNMDLVDLASPFLSNIIKQRAEDAAIHYETVDVVGNLVHSSLNIKKVLDAGALQPVISLLTSYYSDCQRETTYLLGQFATTDSDCKIHILQKSVVRPLIEMLHPTNVQIKEMVAFALWRLTQDTHKQADIAHHSGVQRLQDREFIIQTTKDQCSKFLQLGVGFDDDYVQVLQNERLVSWEILASSLGKAWLSFHMQKGSIVEGTRKLWSYEAVVIILAQNCGVNVIRIMTGLQGKHANGKNAWFGKDGNCQLFFCIVVGILDGLVIDMVIEYHTSKAYSLIQEVVDPYQARATTTRLTIDVYGPFGDDVGSAIMKNYYVLIGASWITSTFNKVWRVSFHEDAEHIDVGSQLKGWSHAINFLDLALVSIDYKVVLLKGLQVILNINLGVTTTAAVIVLGGSEDDLKGLVFDQNLYYMGMKYTTITYPSAFVNILPAVTFILVMISKLEKVNVKKICNLTEIIGIAIMIVGAMVMTLYKDPIIAFIKSGVATHHGTTIESADKHWVIGTIMLLGSIFGWSNFFILQSFTLKNYSAKLSLTALICFVGMMQGAGVSFVMIHDLSAWKVGLNSRFLTATYSGMMCFGITYYVQGVVVRERGPVFVTSFSPLFMIITTSLGAIVLAKKIHLGSIIGAIIIVSIFYIVMWDESKYEKNSETDEESNALQELPISDMTKPNDGGIKKELVTATASGKFKNEIILVATKIVDPKTGDQKPVTISVDDGIQPNTSLSNLAKLKAVFKKNDERTTVGNSSQVSDGAGAVLLIKRSVTMRKRLPILGVFRTFATVGLDPDIIGVGPNVTIYAAVKAASLECDDVWFVTKSDFQIVILEDKDVFKGGVLIQGCSDVAG